MIRLLISCVHLPDPGNLHQLLHPVLHPFHLRLRLRPDPAPQLYPSSDAAEDAAAATGTAAATAAAAGRLQDRRIEDVKGELGHRRFADTIGRRARVGAGVKTTHLWECRIVTKQNSCVVFLSSSVKTTESEG